MGNPIIKTTGLSKRYREVQAVEGLDLSIREGEVIGLLGPNGAGKTTTTLMLLGLTEPTAGSAWIDGHNCTREPIAVKRIVGYLPDNVGFYPDLTGLENLVFTGRLNGLTDAVSRSRAERLLERVGLTYAAGRRAGAYSRGMKQRLGIADVLMKDPKVIIMDEPTLGIDPEGVRELMNLIRQLSAQDGRTLLLSSHQLYQVQQVCDRVGIFVKGRLIACGTIGELGRQLENDGRFLLELQAEPMDEALRDTLAAIPGVKEIQPAGDSWEIVSSRDVRPDVTRATAERGAAILSLRQRGGDLDEIYRQYFEKAGDHDDNHEDARPENGSGGLRLFRRRKKV